MLRTVLFLAFLLPFLFLKAQNAGTILLRVQDEKQHPLSQVNVELTRAADSLLIKILVTDSTGQAKFSTLRTGNYFCRITRVGYSAHSTHTFKLSETTLELPAVTLQSLSETLSGVTVTGRKPFIELLADRTIINLDAGITNVGTTALEALEKLPGITIDKDGNISLKGRTGVTVMLDGKLTYLGSGELATLLQGMSAAEISQVEIMDNPSARYDATGAAGVINIKTKKEKSEGFNAVVNTAYGQGSYAKSNHGIQLNYQNGRWNFFGNYTLNLPRNFSRLSALRTYFQPDDKTIISLLEQPSFFKIRNTTHSLRTGFDYNLNKKTSLGFILNGTILNRSNGGNNTALWMNADRKIDSLIQTHSNTTSNWKNAGVNFNFRHRFTPGRELTVDVDWLAYCIKGKQFFENTLKFPAIYTESSRSDLPTDIRILSARADYSQQVKKIKLEGGWKASHITTDNLTAYEYKEVGDWKDDAGRSNHFLYAESIQAVYTSAQTKLKNWTLQGGLRYERTSYDAQQLGNAVVKDSSFSRRYNSVFPNLFASYAVDSCNSFSINAGRRIDRPAFQKLNPFIFIINKYTYQQGNPFFRPQYTWNIELSHTYKEVLITGVRYSIINDFFSQIFPIDDDGIVIYTEGNLSRSQSFGLSVGTQLSPLPWWSFSAQAVVNRKKLEGVLWKEYKADITQLDFNMTQQARFGKGWSAELAGFYTSRSQQDIQEIVDPTGGLSMGISKTVWQNRGTLKLAGRDLFYTQWMKGLTYFQQANERFTLSRDTRVVTLSFALRFGKRLKWFKGSEGAASEEIKRVGNG